VSGHTDPASGTVTCDGTSCTYTPADGFTGTDSFTYTLTDAAGSTSTATVTIRVPAPVAPADGGQSPSSDPAAPAGVPVPHKPAARHDVRAVEGDRTPTAEDALPFTGAPITALVASGQLVLAIGIVLTAMARRRRRQGC
jgi:hypothetical protein